LVVSAGQREKEDGVYAAEEQRAKTLRSRCR
jgi:hypothetical protein